MSILYISRKTCQEELRRVEEVDFFKQLLVTQGRECVNKCINKLKIEAYPAQEIIIKSGERGIKFYIILRGSVEVLLEQISENHRNVIMINNLSAGQSFGELALMTDKPRLATIVTSEACVFATLHKNDYKEILEEWDLSQFQTTIRNLRMVSGLQQISQRSLSMLSYCCKSINIPRRHTIYKEDDKAVYMYIVIRGTLRLYKQQGRPISVCIVGQFEIIGDYESLNRMNYEFSAECESESAELYKLSKKDLIKVLVAENLPYTLKSLQQIADKKRQNRLMVIRQSQPNYMQMPSIRTQPDGVESTRTIHYSQKNNTYISDSYLVSANTHIMQQIMKRSKLARPVINVVIPLEKAKLNCNTRLRCVSDHIQTLSRLKQQQSLKRTTSVII